MYYDIKNLQLTEDDFKLLIDGLDHLPNKGAPGEMLGELFISMLSDKNPEVMEEHKRKKEIERIREQAAKDKQQDDIKILQGKLLMFKRWLIENDALVQVNDIINPKQ